MNEYLLLFFFSISSIIKNIIRKVSLNKLPATDFVIYNFVGSTIIIILLYTFGLFSELKIKCLNEKIQGIPLYLLIGLTLILNIFTLYVYFYLLKNNDISSIIPFLAGLGVLLTSISGFIFLKEEITYCKSVGIIVVILGIIILNYEDNIIDDN
tara:strand:- start:2810 stop:3271 length:462 start_codon:yes stop_codon:yes gene_type:complete